MSGLWRIMSQYVTDYVGIVADYGGFCRENSGLWRIMT